MLFFLPNDMVMQKNNDGTTSYTLYKYIAAFITIVIAFVIYILCLLPKVEKGKVTTSYQDSFVIISVQLIMMITSIFIIINAMVH